ncbi:uncharacterized protein LOC116133024 [Pistacia vera]|uniref:uncharacterized protein LOC116133024 n=1 Tax=Pistacia vera TaxID=55513 RepID=UPI001263DFCD|nr:uncharacterized protein LOC116133024 [Pistacia vera]XP_031274648.1 uncharacterized protein LOC116133024 [Pistacia vera]
MVQKAMAVGLMKGLRTLGNPLMRCMMRLSKNPALRVALGSGCVQWRRNHQLNSCLEGCCQNGGERDLRDIIRQSNNVGREQSEVHTGQCQMHNQSPSVALCGVM